MNTVAATAMAMTVMSKGENLRSGGATTVGARKVLMPREGTRTTSLPGATPRE